MAIYKPGRPTKRNPGIGIPQKLPAKPGKNRLHGNYINIAWLHAKDFTKQDAIYVQ